MKFLGIGLALTLMAGCGMAQGSAQQPLAITIHDHGFEPSTLALPAGERIKIAITNARKVPAEIESAPMRVERVVPGGTTLDVWVGPLRAGTYDFFDDFNPDTRGTVTVAPAR